MTSDTNVTLSPVVGEMPQEELPRERLLRHGAHVLSDVELLSVLLHRGRPGSSALQLAAELLRQSGGIAGLGQQLSQHRRIKDVGATRLAVVLAALELACRLARKDIPDLEPMSRPATVARYLSLRYAVQGQEVMGAMYLTVKNRLIDDCALYRGTLNRAAVEPRAILRRGLLLEAASFVLFHTHPSGDPSPSAEDLAFTRRVSEAGEVVGIRLVDHLILASATSFLSLRQRSG